LEIVTGLAPLQMMAINWLALEESEV
jgi:hypothetical protein